MLTPALTSHPGLRFAGFQPSPVHTLCLRIPVLAATLLAVPTSVYSRGSRQSFATSCSRHLCALSWASSARGAQARQRLSAGSRSAVKTRPARGGKRSQCIALPLSRSYASPLASPLTAVGTSVASISCHLPARHLPPSRSYLSNLDNNPRAAFVNPPAARTPLPYCVRPTSICYPCPGRHHHRPVLPPIRDCVSPPVLCLVLFFRAARDGRLAGTSETCARRMTNREGAGDDVSRGTLLRDMPPPLQDLQVLEPPVQVYGMVGRGLGLVVALVWEPMRPRFATTVCVGSILIGL
ncbi:hypothetical protein MSAN_01744400 [Mycena sanguinolenta]|uniref:Uncharacterized protein n=1 Tax=Mycena sanguinolenta TaxID=230812 RepID=A0A8H7CTD4_9AGAR|nr:hypothetical protein MSAN_01744400 [Mycena sanguinolenta]